MKYIKLFESWEFSADEIAQKWYKKLNNSFFLDFIKAYPSQEAFLKKLHKLIDDKVKISQGETVNMGFLHIAKPMLETEFKSYPGDDVWIKFYSELSSGNSSWHYFVHMTKNI